jgi:S-adenosylmethionine uptake transporter
MALWCYGLLLVPLSTATALVYSIPLFTLVLSLPILKERVDFHRWLATVVGFVGVFVVLDPTSVEFNPGSLSLIVSAFLFALSDVFNKKYVAKESMLHMLFYTAFFTMILASVPTFLHPAPVTGGQLGWLLAIGCGANLLLYCLLKALGHMEASALAPFRYLDFLVSATFGYLFFHEIPTVRTLEGLLIIVPTSFFLVLKETSTNPSVEKKS